MEELLPSLKNMLKEAIDIEPDTSKLAITLTIKNKIDGILAEPEEIITMLKMYGGLRDEISMEINIDNDTQTITLNFQNEESFKVVAKIFETLWDNAVDLLYQAIESDFSRIKNIPDIDD
ncbi:MAG: hypothetical protein HWN80_05365 [Candidatus Lokiarchaeota archaeon]|nr:hypothetical protein [Candidatus Lokiarchaeota archaeon]